MNDRDLEQLFEVLKDEAQAAPDFHTMLQKARVAATASEGEASYRPSVRPQSPAPIQGAPWWRAVPVGAVLAAAGIGAIAFFGAPSAPEVEFQRAVAWTQSDPVFASLKSPSDVLLEQPEWSLLKSDSPSQGMMSGLSDMLNRDPWLNDERNKS